MTAWIRRGNGILHRPLLFILLASLCFLTLAWLSEELRLLPSQSLTSWPAIWLPAGFALLLFHLFGNKAIIPVFIGQLLALGLVFKGISLNFFTELSILIPLAILQTLQPWLISYLCHRFNIKTDFMFDISSFFISFMLTALIIILEGSFLVWLTTSHFFIDQALIISGLPKDALNFSLANLLGIITLTYPLTGIFFYSEKTQKKAYPELLFWFIASLIVSYATIFITFECAILFIPLLTWAATRFKRNAMSLALILNVIMLLTSLNHSNLISESISTHAITLFQWVISATLACILYINLLIRNSHKVESQLEEKVLERTRQLESINQELRDEIYIRQQAEKSFRSSARQYRALIETAGNPIIVMDRHFIIQKWNSAAEILFGYCRDEIVGKNYIECFVPKHWQDETAWKITKVVESGVSMQNMESETRSFEGTIHTMLWNINRLADNENDTSQVIIVGQDITQIKNSQDKLQYLAHFDALTDTANRRLFEDRCNQALQSARRHQHHIAVINLDIDHFKRINDSFGHDTGDRLLVELTRRIKQCIRKEDTVCRMGGDEFAILLANISSSEGAKVVAKNILNAFSQPVKVQEGELIITCSIGVTLHPGDGETYTELLKNADMAMYRAKSAGRNNIQNYCPEMNEALQLQIRLETDLLIAFKENQFRLFYQPIIDLVTGKMVGLESLLRWQHPDKGLIYPDDFLDVAEQTGLLLSLSEWTFHNACLQGKAALAMSSTPIQITVNLSSRQFSHPDLIQRLSRILEETRFPPQNLIIEISEETIVHHIDISPGQLQKLKYLGVELLLDSFGTGISALSKLQDLPIDIIKIDRSFVQGMPENKNDVTLTETLLSIARQMDLKTIAAGVETQQQANILKNRGCRFVQGHLYSKALPSDEIPGLFKAIREGSWIADSDQFSLPLEDSTS